MLKTTKFAIMLGGNQGNSPEIFRNAVEKLAAAGVVRPVQSRLFRTAAVDCVPGTPDFCNAALIGEWAGSAEELLAVCQRLEREAGRPEKHSSRESRPLDLDLILFGDERRETAFLTRSDAALAARSDAEAFDAVRLLAESAGTAAEQNRKNTLCALENSLRFVCAAFGDEQELWILLHGLQDCGAAAFLQKENSSVYQELLSRATPEAKAAALREELSRGAGL